MNHLPRNAEEMASLLGEALAPAEAPPAPGAPPIDEEYLTMIAFGHFRDLPADQRQTTLGQVAQNAALAELVADLANPSAAQARAARARSLQKRSASNAHERASLYDRAQRWELRIRRIWWMAAMLMMFLGMWRLIFPAAPALDAASSALYRVYAVMNAIRDVLLIVSIFVSICLSIPVAFWELRGRGRNRD